MTDKTLRRKVEAIKRQKLLEKKVVNLSDFRELRRSEDVHTVLVVDDDEVMRNALNRILQGEGYNVLQAEDGLELSRILETTQLDLILLDVTLPWVDGLELCRLIKSQPDLRSVPLVMVSARKSEEDIHNGLKAGADDYVTKPFDVDHILRVINKMLLKSG